MQVPSGQQHACQLGWVALHFHFFPNHSGEQATAWGHTVGEVWTVRIPSGQQHAGHMEWASHCRPFSKGIMASRWPHVVTPLVGCRLSRCLQTSDSSQQHACRQDSILFRTNPISSWSIYRWHQTVCGVCSCQHACPMPGSQSCCDISPRKLTSRWSLGPDGWQGVDCAEVSWPTARMPNGVRSILDPPGCGLCRCLPANSTHDKLDGLRSISNFPKSHW